MIAVSSKGTNFRALAIYLATGRGRDEPERVEWSASRHLPTHDPIVAAKIMHATAMQSQRVEKPVYHLTISFDPTDRVDQALMERVADRVLAALELHEHQVVMVAHRDRDHPHVHLMVNRVHPTTGVAWDGSHDFRRIQEVLREAEREFGLQAVPGRLASLPDREAPERAALTQGEHRQQARGDAVFIESVRAHVQEFRAATSWDDLAARLAPHGLRIERKGQGLVVTDGTHTVKASRIARDVSLRGLERRYGVAYDARDVSADSPTIAAVQRTLVQRAYVRDLAARSLDAELTLTAVRDRGMRAAWETRQPDRAAADRARDLFWAERRAGDARAALTGLPTIATLERHLAHQASRLLPAEVQRVQALAVAPHRLVLPSTKQTVRALVLGEEERER